MTNAVVISSVLHQSHHLKIGLEIVPLSAHSFYNKIMFFFLIVITCVVSLQVTIQNGILPGLNTRWQQATNCLWSVAESSLSGY